MKLTNALIFENLLLLQRVEKEGLPQGKFVNIDGSNLKDSHELISYLLKYDLIETEGDEAVFFLTDVGYKALEVGGWFDNDLAENIEPKKSRELSYSGAETEEEKKNKKPYLTSLRGQALVLSGLVGIGSFLYALDYTEVLDFFDSGKPEKQMEISGSEQEEGEKVSYLKNFDNMTYYQNFNWFDFDGDTLKDSVRNSATIGVEKGEKDSFDVLVYGHHALNDSFHFVTNNGVYTSQFTSYGEKYGNAHDYKREILLDQKKNRILVLLYTRLRPSETEFWPINAMIELYPERYDEYWFEPDENSPIKKDKLLYHSRIRDYINKEKLKTSQHKEYEFVRNGEQLEFITVSTFEDDTLTQEWHKSKPVMFSTKDLKFSNDHGMWLWHYFLHVIEHKDLAEIGF